MSDPHDPKDRFGILQDPKRFQPYLENCFLMPEGQRSFALTLCVSTNLDGDPAAFQPVPIGCSSPLCRDLLHASDFNHLGQPNLPGNPAAPAS